MRLSLLRFSAVLVASILIAIGCSDDGSDGLADSCHVDCFPGLSCTDGVVTKWLGAVLPCENERQACPGEDVYTCPNGCDLPAEFVGADQEPSTLCAGE